MSSKTLDNLIKAGKIEGYDDERNLEHGYIVYLHSGKQWALDPTCHTRGFDTVREAVEEITQYVDDYPDDPELSLS